MQTHRLLAAAILLASLAPALHAENLLSNPGFERNLAAWTVDAYPGLAVRWDSRDALGDRASGSALLIFDSVDRTTSLGRVYQTIPVTANAAYAFGAKIRQNSNPAGATAFVAMFWLAADGRELYQGDTAVVAVDGAWVASSAWAVAPAEAASVQVRLYIREVRGTSISFDDVFVEKISETACGVSCGSSVADGAAIGTPVSFAAEFHAGCASQPEVLWDFGDGSTSNVSGAIHVYSGGGVYRWTLSRVSGEQSCVSSGLITVASLPVIFFFTASPFSVQRGEPVVLSWSTSGASAVSIDGGIGMVPASGSVTIRPEGSGLYTLSATNAAGMTRAQVLIRITDVRRRAVRR